MFSIEIYNCFWKKRIKLAATMMRMMILSLPVIPALNTTSSKYNALGAVAATTTAVQLTALQKCGTLKLFEWTNLNWTRLKVFSLFVRICCRIAHFSKANEKYEQLHLVVFWKKG